MRVVVSGLIGQYAFGGVTWDYIQYVLGFARLGHEVWYLEDTSTWAYDPVRQEPSADCSHNVAYLERVMEAFGLGSRWIYRNGATGEYHGIPDEQEAEKLLRSADVLANVSGACWLREATAAIPLKLFLDGDPMFTQVNLVRPDRPDFRENVAAHERKYSFGLNIGRAGCKVPQAGYEWLPTVQPIATDLWGGSTPAGEAWTTVMNWASYAPVEFDGAAYGQKDLEFAKFIDLPALTSEKFILAMGQGVGLKRPTDLLKAKGWGIVEPQDVIPDHDAYRSFLLGSKAEWSIAKHGYVQSRSGWFSCRSACYLAAGRPVVVQETGWSDHLPSGEGVLSFSTPEEAAEAIGRVAENYTHHSEAARAYARRHFEAENVCASLLE